MQIEEYFRQYGEESGDGEIIHKLDTVRKLSSLPHELRTRIRFKDRLSSRINHETLSSLMSSLTFLYALWKGTPYYAKLDYSTGNDWYKKTLDDWYKKSSFSKVIRTDFLPVYEIARPSPDSMKVLSIIHEARGIMSKKALFEKLQSREYQMIPEYSPSATRSAPHSQLRAILDPLEKHWGFVTVRARGRQSQVTLSEQGKGALRIFGAYSVAG